MDEQVNRNTGEALQTAPVTEKEERAARKKLRPLLRRYLEAEGFGASGMQYVCPVCGKDAWLLSDETWRCNRCGVTGDTVELALKMYPEMTEPLAVKYVYDLLGEKLYELNAVEAHALMDMEFRPAGFLIEKLLGKGLYILAGASKIGKSWMVLGLADCVSRGAPVWGLKTEPCEVLYVSLEDTAQRIQQRLGEVTGGETGRLYIATEAEMLGNGFEEQLRNYLTDHPDTGFVIIDTLQRIRQVKTDSYSYGGDYEVMTMVKRIADEFNITILLVHHTRKKEASDSFNTISGTTGLLGCADGAWVLQKKSRQSHDGTLDVTGREMADERLNLRFDEKSRRWELISFGREEPHPPDPFLEAVRDLVAEKGEWQGTATELLKALGDRIDPETKPNTLTRRLNAAASRLSREYGIDCRTNRNREERTICLSGRDDCDDISPPNIVTETVPVQ